MTRPGLGTMDEPDQGARSSTLRTGLRWPAIAAGAAIAIFLFLGAHLLDVGAADLGIAGIFSTDEQLAGELVRAMVRNGDLGVSHFFSYGPLDLYAARVLLTPYAVLHPVHDEQILVALRLVSLLAGACSLILTFLLGRRLWNAETGAIAVVLLAISPTMLAWSTTAHPDMLQLDFLLLGLHSAIKIPVTAARRSLVAASAFAGLAFTTKYAGVLLLPVIWLAAALPRVRFVNDRGRGGVLPALMSWLIDLSISSVVFFGVFLITDPSAVLEPRRFVSQARLESGLAHQGHVFGSVLDPIGWLRLLADPSAIGGVTLLLGLAGGLIWAGRALQEGAWSWSGASGELAVAVPRGRLVLAAWTLGYLCLLGLWIGDRQARYALPILPPLSLFAAATAVWLARWTRWTALAVGAFLAVAALPTTLALASYQQIQLQRMHRPAVEARIEAGRWLGAHVDHGAPVLRDAYSYVPSNFTLVQETFGLTPTQIDSFRPRIVVTDDDLRSRFLDPAAARSYRAGPAAFQEIASTYAALEAGSVPCYPLLAAFGPVRIYGLISSGDGC